MKNKIKSVSKVFNFLKKLDTYKNNKIFIYTDKSNALDAAKICDQRIHKISKIDGKLFAIKPNIRVKSFPFTVFIVFVAFHFNTIGNMISSILYT